MFSDIENTNVSSHLLHRDQASKVLPSKNLNGDTVRRKPLGAVNFQSASINTGLPAKRVPLQNRIQQAPTEKSCGIQMHAHKSKSSTSHKQVVQDLTRKVVSDVGEKELMIFTSEFDDGDTYQDLWPLKEQPATYVGDFLAWRPSLSSKGDTPLPPVSPLRSENFSICEEKPYDGRGCDVNIMSLSLPSFDEDELAYLSSLDVRYS